MAGSKWDALQWEDGSRYDGEVRERQCHGLGVMRHPNGDRYEGEFSDGGMTGHGVYVWQGETLYRGQWHANHMEGCGVRISRQADGEFLVQEGQFVGDQYLGTFMDCSLPEARHAAAEADLVASKARTVKDSDVYGKMADPSTEKRKRQNQRGIQNWGELILRALGRKPR